MENIVTTQYAITQEILSLLSSTIHGGYIKYKSNRHTDIESEKEKIERIPELTAMKYIMNIHFI